MLEKLLKDPSEKPKVKEADKVSLLPLPTAASFRNWRLNLKAEVVSASGRGDEAFAWISVVDRREVTLVHLGNSGVGFESIDAKLNAAVSKIAKGELGRKLTHETEKLGKIGKMMKGRQALSIIYEHFRTSEEAGALHDLDDLMNVNMNGDKLEAFIQTWDQVLIGMREDPDPAYKRVLFLKQIRKVSDLKYDIAEYDRFEVTHPNRSYGFLYAMVQRHLERRRLEHNRTEMKNLLKGGKPLDAMGTALPGKEKTKPKGDPKATSPSGPKLCHFYNAPGGCKKGKDCVYKHSKDSKGATKARDPSRGRSKTRSKSPGKGRGKSSRSGSPKPKAVCKFHQAGNCKFGANCHFKHEGGGGKSSASPAKEDKPKRDCSNDKKKKQNEKKEEKKEKGAGALALALAAPSLQNNTHVAFGATDTIRYVVSSVDWGKIKPVRSRGHDLKHKHSELSLIHISEPTRPY